MARALIPNSTQIPDIILDHWMCNLSGAELKVVLYIARRTFGFGKESDNVSLNQIANGIKKRDGIMLDCGTGLSISSVARALKSLEEQNILIRKTNINEKNEHDENTYSLNLNWSSEVLPNSENLPPKSTVGYSQNRSTRTPKIEGRVLPNSETQETVQETVQETAATAPIAAAVFSESHKLLREMGLDDAAAKELSTNYSEERIKRQCLWFKLRVADRNPLGALRSSIVEDWGDPQKGMVNEKRDEIAQKAIDEHRKIIKNCALCDEKGNRFVKSDKFPRGAVKKCTHDSITESKFTICEDTAISSISVENEPYPKKWRVR